MSEQKSRPSKTDWYHRRKAERIRLWPKDRWPALREITSRGNLIHTYDKLKREGGTGPGPDGITFTMLSPAEVGEMAGELSRQIAKNQYRPGPTRQCRLEKPNKPGEFRVLNLANISDRVVAKAINGAISPHLNRMFVENSKGSILGTSGLQLLAEMNATILQKNACCVAADDIRKAFDNVNIELLVDAFGKTVRQSHNSGSEGKVRMLTEFVRLVAVGFDQERSIGINQGCPLSPTLLNVFLHQFHDVPLVKSTKSTYWFRYIDDLFYVAKSRNNCQVVHQRSAKYLTEIGLNFKAFEFANLVEQESIRVLGFNITRHGDSIVWSIDKSNAELDLKLADAHSEVDAQSRMLSVLRGWIESRAPIGSDSAVKYAIRAAAVHGFREVPENLLRTTAASAQERWQKLLKAAKPIRIIR